MKELIIKRFFTVIYYGGFVIFFWVISYDTTAFALCSPRLCGKVGVYPISRCIFFISKLYPLSPDAQCYSRLTKVLHMGCVGTQRHPEELVATSS